MSAQQPGDFLRSPLSDALSVLLFAAAGAALEPLLRPLPGLELAVAGAVVACLGPLACAVERGVERPLAPVGALALGALAAAAYALLLRGWLDPGLAGLALRAAPVLPVSALLTRLGPRLDRGEAGWREAARAGPPHGRSDRADAIAGWRLPALGERLLAPLSWLLRLPCLAAIRAYQLTASRLMPPACRFEPSCSRYGYEAFRRHGVLRGGLLTAWRLIRCSPLTHGGHDPVPGIPGSPACRTPGLSCPGLQGDRALALEGEQSD